MSIDEFSDQFDVLLNSYSLEAPFGVAPAAQGGLSLDEYEKSVYLTKAQKEVVIGLYNGSANGVPFEGSEEVRRYLSNLIKEDREYPLEELPDGANPIEKGAKVFSLPADLWYITYESVDTADSACGGPGVLDVYPVARDDYRKTRRNPFRGPNSMRALRLDMGGGMVEIVSKHDVESYYVSYIAKPSPIILADLGEGLEIDGESKAMGCKLHEALHGRILDAAVREALASRMSTSVAAQAPAPASAARNS